MAEVVATAHESSVRRSTIKGYYSEGRKLLDIICSASKRELRKYGMANVPNLPSTDNIQEKDMALFLGKYVTETFFTIYCGARAEKGLINIPKTRVALLKFQKIAGATPWAQDQKLIEVVRGLEASATTKYDESRNPARGAITQSMLQELQGYIKGHHAEFKPKISKEVADDIAEAMEAQFGAALRIREMVDLTADSVVKEGLILVKEKKQRAIAGRRNRPVYKHVKKWPSGKRAWEILARRARRRPEGLLFPNTAWNMNKYNGVIRQAAAAIGLQCRFVLDFESSHCLRHGGIGQAQKEMRQKWTLSQELEALRLSVRMSNWYGRPNEER